MRVPGLRRAEPRAKSGRRPAFVHRWIGLFLRKNAFSFAAPCSNRAAHREETALPWTTVNGVSLHYQLAGDHGPAAVLLHEMRGTLDSWDGVTRGLAAQFRVLRYDQRGAGLSEKVRAQFSNDDAVDDLEGVLKNLDLKPPYNFVCVAAASTQVLRFLERHPDQVASIVLCNPAPGVDPSRAGALRERADLAERDGIRGVMGITLDKSYPSDLGERAAYEAYRGRYLGNDPVGFA